MRIIHCSDLHLDSKMKSNLSSQKAKERRNEILITYQKMVDYAKENDVKVILIAGDMFDKKDITVKAKNIVLDSIKLNPEIDFIYLKGNHDEAGFIENEEEKPSNLKLFNSNMWTCYSYGNITISGIEFEKKNNYEIYNSLILEKNKLNIVVMHGQDVYTNIKDRTEIIDLKQLKNKNIDYLALGHIHKYKQEKLDNRGIYCYSGCLEGRGFDECGEKGFVLLDIEENKIKTTFVPCSKRIFYEVKVDITGAETNAEIEEKIRKEIENIDKTSLVKVVLTGEVELGSERDIEYLTKKLETEFYFLKIYDKPKIKIDYLKNYKYDASLKGEFIRYVLEQELADEEKSKIINIGIKALSGEEV